MNQDFENMPLSKLIPIAHFHATSAAASKLVRDALDYRDDEDYVSAREAAIEALRLSGIE